jgi:hypothetical protein
MIGGRVFDTIGDYRYAFYAASALAVIAFGSLALVRPLDAEPSLLGAAFHEDTMTTKA